MEKNSLQLLADYSNDEESSNEEFPRDKISAKRTFEEIDTPKLPVPDFVKKKEDMSWIDNPSEHHGRIRSFKHERGNWATFVYIPYRPNSGISSLQESIMNCLPDVPVQKVDDLHLSLTRTVILKYHWIHPFINSIKGRVCHYRRFVLGFGNLKVYCNEEKTRTFIGLEVTSAQETLHSLIEELDICLSEFKLPAFYKDPSFHVSILWTLGDMETKLDSYLPHLNLMLNKVVAEHANENWCIDVNYLFCKTGNKMFQFPLD